MPSAPLQRGGRKKQVSRLALERARRELRELSQPDPKQTVRSLVADLYDVIREKREQGLRWPTIHQAINAQFPIHPRSLALYFAQIHKERSAKPTRPRRPKA